MNQINAEVSIKRLRLNTRLMLSDENRQNND